MHVSTLLKKTNRLMLKKANELLKPHGLTHAYTYFLMELYEQDGLTQSEIHKKIGIEQPTAVRTLDRMERDGFIVREPSQTDRRAVCIKLTDKAKGYKAIIYDCAKQLNDTALHGITKPERLLLQQLVGHINENLEK